MPNAPDITAQSATLANALQQRIDLFVNHLQQNGFEVLPAQRGAIEYIFLRQMTEDSLQNTEQLQNNLCPIVARNAKQQTQFIRNFATWFPPVSENENKPNEDTEKVGRPKAWRDHHGIVAFCLLILLAVSIIASIKPHQKSDPVQVGSTGKEKVIRELPTGKIIEEPQQYITINKKVPHPIVLPLRIALTSIPFFIFLLWLFNRWRKRIMWLSHAPVEKVLTERQYSDSATDDNLFSNLFQNADFQNAGRRLHRYREENTNDLNIQKTVLKTVAASGYFTPVYRTRKFSPDYLFLIEQKDRNDHMARMVDVAISRFRDQNIHVERYYYRTDLRRLVHDDEEQTVANLEDLSEKLQDHRMVIVGTADGLFHPLTGEIRSWADVFNHWETRTLLSARPLNEWTEDHEIRLLESGFSLATASVKGISAFAKGVSSAEIDRGGALLEGRIVRPDEEESVERQTDHPPLTVFRDADFAPEMIMIPSGSFMMGSPESEKGRFDYEGPQHQVTIDYSFAVSQYPITFDEWDTFIKDSKYSHKDNDRGWGRGRRPVIGVEWKDAQAYVRWLSEKTGYHYRMLNEAEWEYCCRAGTERRYWWGDDITPEQANYDGNIGKTVPVDHYKPNPWGLYQMHGNVWEWCEDEWHNNYVGAPIDGSAWVSSSANKVGGRVLRGGSWYNFPLYLRSACRSGNQPTIRIYDVGFRISRTSFTS